MNKPPMKLVAAVFADRLLLFSSCSRKMDHFDTNTFIYLIYVYVRKLIDIIVISSLASGVSWRRLIHYTFSYCYDWQVKRMVVKPHGLNLWKSKNARRWYMDLDIGLLTNTMIKNYEKINQLMASSSGSDATGPQLTLDEAFTEVMSKEHSGRIKCGGHGETPTSWYGKGNALNNINNKKVEELQNTITTLQASVAEFKEFKN